MTGRPTPVPCDPALNPTMGQVTESRETYKILDLALRIGEILLSSGAGAADVTATMLGVTHHLGLRNADVDVTFTLLRMSYQDDPDEMPVLLSPQHLPARHRLRRPDPHARAGGRRDP